MESKSRVFFAKNTFLLTKERYFDKNVNKVSASLGWEQEYFLIDKALYNARPDIMMRNKRLKELNNMLSFPLISRPDSSKHNGVAQSKSSTNDNTFITTSIDTAPSYWKKEKINVNNIRNYETSGLTRGRHCSKCSPNRDPVTRKSITQLRMGLSVDERRGVSPSRILTSGSLGKFLS